jgi:hypothetical protein
VFLCSWIDISYLCQDLAGRTNGEREQHAACGPEVALLTRSMRVVVPRLLDYKRFFISCIYDDGNRSYFRSYVVFIWRIAQRTWPTDLLNPFRAVNLTTFLTRILVTVHLGIILINNQLDAQFLLYIFISILYMFRANLCSSSGEPILSIHLVYVTLCRWPSGVQVGKELPEWHTPDVVLIQLTLLMMSTDLLETCGESK